MPNFGQVKLTKFDGGKPVVGASYEVINVAGKVVDTLLTGADGSATSKDLDAGTYRVREKQAPFGYELDTEVHTATVDKGTKNINVVDTHKQKMPQTGSNRPLAVGIAAATIGATMLYLKKKQRA